MTPPSLNEPKSSIVLKNSRSLLPPLIISKDPMKHSYRSSPTSMDDCFLESPKACLDKRSPRSPHFPFPFGAAVKSSPFYSASLEQDSPMMRMGRRLFGHSKSRRTYSCGEKVHFIIHCLFLFMSFRYIY